MRKVYKSDTMYINTGGRESSTPLPIDAEIIDFDCWLGGYGDTLFSITYTSDINIEATRTWSFIACDDYEPEIKDEFEFITTLRYEQGTGNSKKVYYLFHIIELTKQEIREDKIDEIISENE